MLKNSKSHENILKKIATVKIDILNHYQYPNENNFKNNLVKKISKVEERVFGRDIKNENLNTSNLPYPQLSLKPKSVKIPESKKEKSENTQNYDLLEKKIKIIPKVNIKEENNNNNINPFSKNNYPHKNKHKEEKASVPILLEECELKQINNPQYVTDYSAGIFEYLKETEVNNLFLLFYRN